MPRFNYGCKSCGNVESHFNPPTSCVKCGSSEVGKVFSPPTSLTIDVPGGYEYRDGVRAWRKRMTDSQYAQVLLDERDPY